MNGLATTTSSVAAIMIIVQFLKRLLPNRFIPILALVLGIVFGLIEKLSFEGFIQGVLYGGSAMGFYRGGKVVFRDE